MSEGERGEIAGGTFRERCVRLAGLLAERSQARVILRGKGEGREFAARVTDLPGELVRAGPGVTLVAPEMSTEFEIGPERIEWRRVGDARE